MQSIPIHLVTTEPCPTLWRKVLSGSKVNSTGSAMLWLNFTHKRPIIWGVCPCHDVILFYALLLLKYKCSQTHDSTYLNGIKMIRYTVLKISFNSQSHHIYRKLWSQSLQTHCMYAMSWPISERNCHLHGPKPLPRVNTSLLIFEQLQKHLINFIHYASST